MAAEDVAADVVPATSTARAPQVPVRDAARRRPAPFDPFGLAVAAGFVCLSLTPSLLPRSPVFQGWLSGIVAAIGYGLGVLVCRAVTWPAGRLTAWRPSARLRRAGRRLVAVGAPVAVGILLVAGRRWQREAHVLAGEQPPGWFAPLLIVSLAVSAFLALVAAGRLLRSATAAVARRLPDRLPETVAAVTSVVLMVAVLGAVLDQVVLRAGLALLDRAAAAANDETIPDLNPPSSGVRSGGPGSLVAWDDLGLQGRKFVTGGPTDAQLAAFTGAAARTPVRVYVGLAGVPDPAERVRTAVAELERTGAFSRSVLCVVTTTGTGWVDPEAAAALELLHGGDTAIVTTQYSFLPSPVSFLFDDDQVEKEGTALFAAIRARWEQLPAGQRPRLLLYGESLGSNGGQAALGDPSEGRAEAALFVGSPGSNRLWRDVVPHRDPGTPQRLPVYRAGAAVRFADTPESLRRQPTGPWGPTRVLFLQHASDPVVWWSPDLLLQRPDWLREPRGPRVTTSMSWYPIVTFWQVTADLVESNRVPAGAGHRYGNVVADAWASLAPPAGWTDADTARLRAAVAAF